MAVNILGIRHHGVGSAKRVKSFLKELKPDIIFIEGPPEIEEVLPYICHKDLKPPVAIMLYNEDQPGQSSFYPFAKYSPEWAAAEYANKNKILLRALDLPAKISFAPIEKIEEEVDENYPPISEEFVLPQSKDPMLYLAQIAGYEDGEQWWEYQFEGTTNKESDEDHFNAVLQAMSALREQAIPTSLDVENIAREAFMRDIIRKAETELYSNIAVICGAWHAPALIDLKGTEKGDAKIIKSQPKSKVKVKASWIPWTNDRLSYFSGYGAGITSPGFYEFKEKVTQNVEVAWLTKVAQVFRKEGIDTSTAHVLETYRLTNALCQLRGKSHSTLYELNEAVLTVMCMGDAILLELIKKKLIVGNRIGEVPEDIPKVPLQQDFEKTIKKLRLKLSASDQQLDLDLRTSNDLERSILFHRLEILSLSWAKRTSSRTKGTFKESWVLVWSPAMIIALIDNAYLGNTIESAALSKLKKQCEESDKIVDISNMVDTAIPAELNAATDFLLNKLDELSTISSDVQELMTAIPKLVNISKYGNVRKSDMSMLNTIVERLLTKIFIGLPNACYGLDEDNSNNVFVLISGLQSAIKIYDVPETTIAWYNTLHTILSKSGIHDIIEGCTCRLLLDAEQIDHDTAIQYISRALSVARDPHEVASWVEGFLRGSGMILIYDHRLWNILYGWVISLEEKIFLDLVPYLRRAFSKFDHGERKQIGTKAKRGIVQEANVDISKIEENWNEARAIKVFETIKILTGI
jgi:hypothetical protein